MAVTAALFGKSIQHFVQGDIAYLNDTIKVALLDASYTFAQDTHETFADVVANEVGATATNGYTARGRTLATKSVGYDDGLNRTRAFAEDSFWTPDAGVSLSASHAVVYKDTGTNATSWLIGYVNFGTVITATGAPLTINWNDTDGVFHIDAAGV